MKKNRNALRKFPRSYDVHLKIGIKMVPSRPAGLTEEEEDILHYKHRHSFSSLEKFPVYHSPVLIPITNKLRTLLSIPPFLILLHQHPSTRTILHKHLQLPSREDEMQQAIHARTDGEAHKEADIIQMRESDRHSDRRLHSGHESSIEEQRRIPKLLRLAN